MLRAQSRCQNPWTASLPPAPPVAESALPVEHTSTRLQRNNMDINKHNRDEFLSRSRVFVISPRR